MVWLTHGNIVIARVDNEVGAVVLPDRAEVVVGYAAPFLRNLLVHLHHRRAEAARIDVSQSFCFFP